jgi:hypothetical protein
MDYQHDAEQTGLCCSTMHKITSEKLNNSPNLASRSFATAQDPQSLPRGALKSTEDTKDACIVPVIPVVATEE